MSRGTQWLAIVGIAAVIGAGAGLGIAHMKSWRKAAEVKPAATQLPPGGGRVREPAVAGLFYPGNPQHLSRAIDAMLAAARPDPVPGELKALICPHAGYQYSGPVAAFAYKLLAGRDVETIVLLAPSHYAPFAGASVCSAAIYRTPLGDVAVSEKSAALAKLAPFMPEPRVPLQRPGWCVEASHPIPPPGEDTPETWEHSGEVQVPFLQKVLPNFKLVPVVFGETDPAAAAKAIAGLLDDRTVIVASSDLSHYHPYEEARVLDAKCVKAICALDTGSIHPEAACGSMPVRTVIELAKLKGWKPKLLDLRNSGDVTGDRSRGVVGYASIAFYAPETQIYSHDERKLLLELARKTLREVVTKMKFPDVDPAVFPRKFTEPKGCFVTLTVGGELRGCIGHIIPQEPLYRAIMDNAQSAAQRDHRFTPVRPDELDKIEIEISVLTEPQPLAFTSPEDLLAKLKPHRDGVVLQPAGRGQSTYLPQVWEHFPKKEDFLNTLSQKAGCAPGDWRQPGTRVLTYRVECFKESEK
jgi:hypothetical protein